MGIKYAHGDAAEQGGVDITISLTPAERDALGLELSTLVDWMDTALWALVLLRTGQSDRAGRTAPLNKEQLYTVINDLDHRLLPRLGGIRDAAIRAHRDAGGSLDDLALAMDVVKSTAQYRRTKVLERSPELWERWAVDGGPERRTTDDDQDTAAHHTEVYDSGLGDDTVIAVCRCGKWRSEPQHNVIVAARLGKEHADAENALDLEDQADDDK